MAWCCTGRSATTAQAWARSQVALQRGNGLAGMRQRVWAFGGDLACEAALDGTHARRGLRLSARFVVPRHTAGAEPQTAMVAG